MTKRYRICAVVPAYNREKYIAEALDSIASQTRTPDEIVVVDDGSTDGTLEIVRSWGDSHDLPFRLIVQANGGPASARNTAMRSTDAELIAPLDSDDVWVPTHVEKLERAFHHHPDLVVVTGNTKRLDNLSLFKQVAYDEELFEQMQYDETSDGLRLIKGSAFTSLLRGAYIQTSSCMFRLAAAKEIGFLDESLRSFEDQLFFLRLSRLGGFGLYMEPVTLLRKHDDNITHRRHIASHIINAIDALGKADADADAMGLTKDEHAALKRVLKKRLSRATERASRYGIRPYWNVCRDLIKRGHLESVMRPKPLLRAMLIPSGDQDKLQQRTAEADCGEVC